MAKKVSTTVYLTDEQNEALGTLSERTKVPVAVYIREGIDALLQKHRALIDEHLLIPEPPPMVPPRRPPLLPPADPRQAELFAPPTPPKRGRGRPRKQR
jgi:hypothetical protein